MGTVHKPRPVPPPSPEYIGPPAHSSAGSNKPIYRIVIHSAVCPCEPGWAREIASYFMQPDAGGSAHYCVDPDEVIQSAWDSVIAWHAPPNPHSIGVEMCDTPGPVPNDPPWTARFKALRKAWRWRKRNQQRMLRRTAQLTAQLCLAYDVPLRFIGRRKLQQGYHGITTHALVSKTWRQSTHWDPGWWPRRRFMKMVHEEAAKLTSPNA